jgi:transposase
LLNANAGWFSARSCHPAFAISLRGKKRFTLCAVEADDPGQPTQSAEQGAFPPIPPLTIDKKRDVSNDLRERILTAVDNREGSRRKLAARFGVNTSTITRLLQLRRQTGSFEPRPNGDGTAPTLDQDGLERLRDLVKKTPDITLDALQQGLGVGGSIRIVWRGLRKLDITLKRKSPRAAERDRPEVQKRRHTFRRDVEPIEPERFVFVDETGVTTAMTPTSGRAPRGERVEASAPASWESVTVIAALSLDGVRAPLAFPGAVNAATFQSDVEQVLVPALREGDVAVFDNLKSHLGPAVVEAIERAGASVLPLPPYSPDFTPIEEMFSKFKAFLCRFGARAKDHLHEAIVEGLRMVTPRDILGWFRHAGLCATQP